MTTVGSPTKLLWVGARDALERAGDALSEELHPPADAVSLTNDDPTRDDDAADWRLEAYFADEPDADAIALALPSVAALGPPQTERLPDIDWVAEALEGLGVVRCGRFILYGGHDAEKALEAANADRDAIPIRIDANLAFGTGHHPTTAGCLELFSRFAGFAPKRILDLGCGSGVLAIAAAKMWGRNALASDIDADSVRIAAINADMNNVGGAVRVIEADGFAHPEIDAASPFDFVFANILAGPLQELAPTMAGYVSKNGRVMLAGLMRAQEPAVTEAYEAAGFRLINRLDHDTWPVLLFARA